MIEIWIPAFFYVMLENIFDKSQKFWIRFLFLALCIFTLTVLLMIFILLIYGGFLAVKEQKMGIALLFICLASGLTYGFYTLNHNILSIKARNIK